MAVELENGNPPEWMIALENKRKQHKLAHEVGAGATCLNCGDGCIGLDLHFWRKICRNCKCKKEAHDVKEESTYEQFDILFGSGEGVRQKQFALNLKLKTPDDFGKELKNVEVAKQNGDIVLDWIPTDVSEKLASEYLQQLPADKLPISGSAGAVFRKQQLQKQIPIYDFKINDPHDLTEEETQAFTEYVENLKNNAVGKGQVTKILPKTFINETESNCDLNAKPKYVPNNLNSSPKPFMSAVSNISSPSQQAPSPLSTIGHSNFDLKTPSAFVPYRKHEQLSKLANLENDMDGLIDFAHKFKVNNDRQSLLADHPYILGKNEHPDYDNPTTQMADSIRALRIACAEENGNYPPNEDADAFENYLRSLEHRDESPNRTVNRADKPTVFRTQMLINNLNSYGNCAQSPTSDLAKRGNSDRSPLSDVRTAEDLGRVPTSDLSVDRLSESHARQPVDAKLMKLGGPEQFQALSSYVNSMPQQVIKPLAAQGVKKNRTPKVRFGDDTTIYYSDDEGFENEDEEEDESQQTLFCHQCKLELHPGEVAVRAERAGTEVIWHPQCFVCIICKELLVDLVYFFNKGDVYCGRHYAEVRKIPRCFACDELIFLKEYTVAEGQSFHVKHFCCFECDIPLAGMQYIPKDGNPVCLNCFQEKYGKKCKCCQSAIKAEDPRVGWKELNWHATPLCFKCVICSKSLLDSKFMVKNNDPLCSKECAAAYGQQRNL